MKIMILAINAEYSINPQTMVFADDLILHNAMLHYLIASKLSYALIQLTPMPLN